MSGLFSSPRPAAASVATSSVSTPVATTSTANSADTTSDPAEDPVATAIAVMQRRERGLGGTVLTSWRGLLTPSDQLPRRRQLLGE